MCGGEDNHGNSLLCVVISVHTYNERVLWRHSSCACGSIIVHCYTKDL